jgi:exopolysaccharide biosynthesis polyprenyl glycosylphosphotransferase
MKNLLRKNKLLLVVLDVISVLIASYSAQMFRMLHSTNFAEFLSYYTGATCLAVAIFIGSFYIFDLYNVKRNRLMSDRKYIAVCSLATLNGIVWLGLCYYMFPSWRFGRGIFVIYYINILILCLFTRRVIFPAIERAIPVEKIVLYGWGPQTEMLLDALRNDGASKRKIVAILKRTGKPISENIPEGVKFLPAAEMPELIKLNGIDLVAVETTNEPSEWDTEQFLACKRRGIIIVSAADYYINIFGKIPVDAVRIDDLIFDRAVLGGVQVLKGKLVRIIDMACSAAGLILASPIAALSILLIKATSKGPFLFVQERVGLDGKTFSIYKMRTMVDHAEDGSGPVWAKDGDRRITGVGRFLRKTRIDEIPQLINVLKGDMSMVGPRPERPFFVQDLAGKIPYYSLRHLVKPGITGWAQVNYRYGASIEDAREKLKYDLYFVRQATIYDYMKIILMTVQTVISRPGT